MHMHYLYQPRECNRLKGRSSGSTAFSSCSEDSRHADKWNDKTEDGRQFPGR